MSSAVMSAPSSVRSRFSSSTLRRERQRRPRRAPRRSRRRAGRSRRTCRPRPGCPWHRSCPDWPSVVSSLSARRGLGPILPPRARRGEGRVPLPGSPLAICLESRYTMSRDRGDLPSGSCPAQPGSTPYAARAARTSARDAAASAPPVSRSSAVTSTTTGPARLSVGDEVRHAVDLDQSPGPAQWPANTSTATMRPSTRRRRRCLRSSAAGQRRRGAPTPPRRGRARCRRSPRALRPAAPCGRACGRPAAVRGEDLAQAQPAARGRSGRRS